MQEGRGRGGRRGRVEEAGESRDFTCFVKFIIIIPILYFHVIHPHLII